MSSAKKKPTDVDLDVQVWSLKWDLSRAHFRAQFREQKQMKIGFVLVGLMVLGACKSSAPAGGGNTWDTYAVCDDICSAEVTCGVVPEDQSGDCSTNCVQGIPGFDVSDEYHSCVETCLQGDCDLVLMCLGTCS